MQSNDDRVVEEILEGACCGDEHEIYAEIAAAVSGQRKFAVSPEDALELSRVLDAIRVSSEENRVIRIFR